MNVEMKPSNAHAGPDPETEHHGIRDLTPSGVVHDLKTPVNAMNMAYSLLNRLNLDDQLPGCRTQITRLFQLAGRIGIEVNGGTGETGDDDEPIPAALPDVLREMQEQTVSLSQIIPGTGNRIADQVVRDLGNARAGLMRALDTAILASTGEMDYQIADIPALLSEIINDYGNGREDIGIMIPERYAGKFRHFPVPAVLFRMVVGNFVSNAVKYSLEDSGVTVRVTVSRDGFLTVKVKDHGLGIKRRDIEKILDPDTAYRTAESCQYADGWGVGITFCHRLLREHVPAGAISLASRRGKNRGTTATLRLPVGPTT